MLHILKRWGFAAPPQRRPEDDPDLLSTDKTTRDAALSHLMETWIKHPDELQRFKQRDGLKQVQQQRAAALEERFEALADWWIDQADDIGEDEQKASEAAGHQFVNASGRIHGQRFSEKSITTFFRTVDEIKRQAKTLSYGEITVQLRDATLQLLASR